MKKRKKIEIREVGPRDGLQNESKWIPTASKIELIQNLKETGISYIELSSFVSPKAIPQLRDAKKVVEATVKLNSLQTSVLVPNELGMQRALECGVREVAVFTAASDTFNLKNIGVNIKDSFKRFKLVFKLAEKHKVRVRGYISTAFVCPYEGEIKPKQVDVVAKRLLDEGCYEVSIGDTIGKATPQKVEKVFKLLLKRASKKIWAGHFHDTYGLALVNVLASLNFGIYKFDSSVGGLGGCPYAPGAGGNLATEKLVYFAEKEGLKTGVNLEKLLGVSEWFFKKMKMKNRSNFALAKGF